MLGSSRKGAKFYSVGKGMVGREGKGREGKEKEGQRRGGEGRGREGTGLRTAGAYPCRKRPLQGGKHALVSPA